jgi:hypothetical protein
MTDTLTLVYNDMKTLVLFLLAAIAAISAPAQQPPANHDLGYKDTPILPGLPWHVHDPDRPHPRLVTPSDVPGGAPSDAIVLYDGHDLSQWKSKDGSPPKWIARDGYFEVVPETGDLATKDKFGDCQLHIEWAEAPGVTGTSQGRGNSGVFLMGRFEIQVLDPWHNPTYADGQAAAIYGQWPPLVNPGRPPGQWQVYDIVFEAPRFDGDKLVKPAYVTVIFNGVLVHNHQAIMGPTLHRQLAHYEPQPAEDSLVLQNHHNAVRFRNIWIRRLGAYDEPEK